MYPVQLLWTGGWDSTYRLLSLLLVEQRAVQPLYVIDSERASTLHEIRAMEAIRAGVSGRLPASAALLATEVHVRTDFMPSAQLEAMYASLGRRVRIGSQYLWLAAVAEEKGWSGV